MTKKSFKLTHKPGQSSTQHPTAFPPAATAEFEESGSTTGLESESHPDHLLDPNGGAPRRSSRTGPEAARLYSQSSPTTRKTIEVPEEYFFRVKMHALQRRIKEKDMWAEILEEYFSNHPEPK